MALDRLIRTPVHGEQPRIKKGVKAGLALFIALAVGGLQYVARRNRVAVSRPVQRQEGIK